MKKNVGSTAERLAKKLDKAMRLDGWKNVITGLGTRERDKRKSSGFECEVLSYQECGELYRGDDMAARIIDLPVDEMTREWVEICVEDDKKTAESVVTRMEELQVQARIEQAMRWERAFGGAGILLGADDGQKDLTRPLDLERVKSFKWMTVLDRRELEPERWYEDATAPKYGEVEIYRIQPLLGTSTLSKGRQVFNNLVHESRLIIFKGVQVTRLQMREQHGWGDSVLQRVHEVLTDFQMSWGGAAHLLSDFSQAVYKIKGLAELIAANEDETIINRFRIIDLARSLVRAVVIDADEDFERKTTPMSGVPEVLDRFSTRMAAAAQMPVTLMMGQSPAGLNATGASDIRFFYDTIKAKQTKHLVPPLERVLTLIFKAKEGPTKGKEPEKWSIKPRPLWQLTEKEQAEVRKLQAETDEIYINSQVAAPEEIAISRFGGDKYSTETVIDFESRKEMADATQAIPGDPKETETMPGEERERGTAG